jgi:hypothetical protein
MQNTQSSITITQLLPWFEVAAERISCALSTELGEEEAHAVMDHLHVRAGLVDDTSPRGGHQAATTKAGACVDESPETVACREEAVVFFGQILPNIRRY